LSYYKTLPSIAIIPQTNQTTKLIPTDPDPSKTPLGDTNIPDPTKVKALYKLFYALSEIHGYFFHEG